MDLGEVFPKNRFHESTSLLILFREGRSHSCFLFLLVMAFHYLEQSRVTVSLYFSVSPSMRGSRGSLVTTRIMVTFAFL